MATTTISHKRGDSFGIRSDLTGALVVNNTPVTSLTGFALSAQLRSASGALVQQLEVVTFTGMEFALRATAAQSAVWPVGRLRCDLQVSETGSGLVASTATFIIEVLEDVTHA